MSRSISKAQLLEENASLKTRLKARRNDALAGLVTKLSPWVVVAYLGNKAIDGLGGKTTSVSVVVHLGITFAAAGVTGLWGYLERRHRLQEVSRLTKELKECRQKLDPGRGSSNLTSTGCTHEEDEP